MSSCKEFLELEAEEGSDNELHDEISKKVKNDCKDEEENEDPNKNIEDLINEYVPDVNKKNDHKAFRCKFLQDEIKKDKKELKMVINNDYRRKRKWNEVLKEDQEDEIEDDGEVKSINPSKFSKDGNDLAKRKKVVSSQLNLNNNFNSQSDSQSSQSDGLGLGFNKKNIISISKCKKIFQLENEGEGEKELDSENEESQQELINEVLLNYEIDVKKKISEQSTTFKKKFKDRLKENNEIMANVINLNKVEIEPKDKNKNLKIYNSNSNNIVSNVKSVEANKKPYNKSNQFLPHSISLSQSSQNSFLNAMKNDKNYNSNFASQNQNQSQRSDSNSEFLCQQVPKKFSVFNTVKNNKLDSEKKMKISAIFERSNITEKIKIKDK